MQEQIKAENYYPGISYQRLFDAINEVGPNPTTSQMTDIIRIIKIDFIEKDEVKTSGPVDGKPMLAAGFIPVEQLPTASMKVKWLCEDGVEDVGFYYHQQKEFASWDLCSEKPITHWKPSEDVSPACR